MPKASSKLKSVVLDEISFVGSGDNPEAHVMLLKMKPGPVEEIVAVAKDFDGDKVELLKTWAEKRPLALTKSTATSFFELLYNQQIRDYIWDMVWALEDSISSIMYDDSVTSKGEAISETVDQFREAITALTKGETAMPKELQKKLEEAEEKIVKLEGDNETLTTEVTTLKSKGDDGACGSCGHVHKEEETTIDKSKLPADVVALIEKNEADLNKQSARLLKMEDDNLTVTMVSKAAALPHIGSAEEVSKVLKSLHKSAPDSFDATFELLQKADARIKEGVLLKEETNDVSSGSGVMAQIKAKANDLRKANPALSDEQAFVSVFKADPELRSAYIAEQNQQ